MWEEKRCFEIMDGLKMAWCGGVQRKSRLGVGECLVLYLSDIIKEEEFSACVETELCKCLLLVHT